LIKNKSFKIFKLHGCNLSQQIIPFPKSKQSADKQVKSKKLKIFSSKLPKIIKFMSKIIKKYFSEKYFPKK